MHVLLRLLVVTAAVASAAPAAQARAQDAAGLSPARFAALDAVYVASLPLDRNPTSAQVAELRRVCDALDRSDRLLAVERASCLTGVDVVGPSKAFARCTARRGCRRAVRTLRVVLRRSLADARAANRIVALELAPGACRTELRAGRALLRSLEALRDGLALLERGLRTNDRAVIRRAERRIAAAGERLADQPTAAQSLEVFRGVCGPSQP
ncbi:MAG TPA: hypothetical protein VGO80_07615 [Solirubrobacteraceae bacterium]|nr:hypothetical protein [Solirubrobacteraceae bacterium]